jgi:hypothetical protein
MVRECGPSHAARRALPASCHKQVTGPAVHPRFVQRHTAQTEGGLPHSRFVRLSAVRSCPTGTYLPGAQAEEVMPVGVVGQSN